MIKPPIKYFGGKNGMINEINKHDPNPVDYHIYCEVFGGSGGKLLSRPLGHVEIYNDLYHNVYALYKVLSDSELFPLFKNLCDLSIYSEQLRKEFKENLKKDHISLVQRAFYYWYVNRTSHNGIGGISINCYIRRNMAKSTSDFLSCIDRLKELHDRLSSVVILNRDALEVIKQYDAPNVFFYLDPPYSWETRTSTRYSVDFNPEQQKQLVDTILSCKGKVLLSGYINEEYKRLENSGWKRIDFQVNTVSGTMQKKIKTESLWKNY